MPEWIVAGIGAVGAGIAAIIAGRASRKTNIESKTTAAYAELVDEVRKYRGEAQQDGKRIDELEKLVSESRRRIACLETAREMDRSWIRRTIERVTEQAPAHLDLLRPFPDWHTD